ncbi:DUF2653 family protein [Cohnella nanjingensis]|uniref:DUF2653 family protein n=1 Tax=Cohnella nanjingensis TaxID=1387779 RepID=A0A7X0RKF4_9BACL|nr:DUF2653 family protein [Cohnella nanjingensis]MBB6669134.1 DUF2653 family protein [Cohnella nanjingensis]
MRITMDEIVNAVCAHMAERQEVPVTAVEVELNWDEDQGYTAEVWVQGRSRYLVEANLKESIMRYMLAEYDQRVYPSQITLMLDDEIYAEIEQ